MLRKAQMKSDNNFTAIGFVFLALSLVVFLVALWELRRHGDGSGLLAGTAALLIAFLCFFVF